MTTATIELDCLILAAGGASRFGSCKQLADWQGRPLLATSIAIARALEPARILVVAGAFYSQLMQMQPELDAELTGSTDRPIELLNFPAWQLGVGNSLAFGVKELQNSRPVLVLLGDQPLVNAQDLRNLLQAWCKHPDKIACASFANTWGVPALFPAHFKARLYQCRGDRGAKKLMMDYPDQVVPVVMPSAEFDVDTPADLARYLPKSN